MTGQNNRVVKKYFKIVPAGLFILLTLFAASIFLFSYISHEIFQEKEEALDQKIFSFFSAHIMNSHLTPFMKTVTYFASTPFLLITTAGILLLFIVFKKLRLAFEIAAISIGGFLVNYFMKLSFHRIRPPGSLIRSLKNFSFPSGHATSGFIFYGLAAYLIWQTKLPRIYKYVLGILLILFSLLIGFSRIYLRMHYASDVLAGFCIGFAWLILMVWLFKYIRTKRTLKMGL
jgi:membrane-associated phospholipid phosphatase